MTSVPATELPDGAVMALRRPAPHVRTYLLPCVLSIVLFFPTAIPGIVHAVKARRHVREGNVRDARAQGDLARQWFWMTVGIGSRGPVERPCLRHSMACPADADWC